MQFIQFVNAVELVKVRNQMFRAELDQREPHYMIRLDHAFEHCVNMCSKIITDLSIRRGGGRGQVRASRLREILQKKGSQRRDVFTIMTEQNDEHSFEFLLYYILAIEGFALEQQER